MEQAVSLLQWAVDGDKAILIVGDFDADGATSTALAVRALSLLGARSVSYLVPNRFEFGYGLTPEIVDIAKGYQPDLIVTVDNGISSHSGVDRAKALGMKVLITDHHLAAATLPNADAIVNPNCRDDGFPSKALAGVGTIFYVLLALRSALREQAWFEKTGRKEPNLADLLDLVALGTVADVVPLDKNNRILVAQGLARIRSGRCCAGIQALIQVSGKQAQNLVASDLGFALGPRLNAAGRMEDMSIGIECLLSNDMDKALQLSIELDKLNRERKQVESQMKRDALDFIDQMSLDSEKDLPLGLCLYDPGWHKGVIGILASRIKDNVHRPVIAFANVNEGSNDLIQGSARSISGVHIRDVLDAIATRCPHILNKFGGHAMAAGLTLEQRNFQAFCREFDSEVGRCIKKEEIGNTVLSDGELQAQDISLDLANQIRFGGPWGQGFPEPLFDGEFKLINRRIVGQDHLKMTLCANASDKPIEAIAFQTTDAEWPENVTTVKLVYQLSVNEYRQRQTVQLLVRHIQPLPAHVSQSELAVC